MKRWTRWIRISAKAQVAVVAGLALLLAGALVAALDDTTVGTVGDEGDEQAVATAVTEDRAVASDATGSAGAAAAGIAAPTPPRQSSGTVGATGPRIVRTADIAVEVREGGFGAAFDRVATIATAHGGFVVSSSTTSGEERSSRRPTSGEVTLRVPVDRFDAVRTALGDLGTLERASIRGEDVSGQIVDYDARLRALKAQEDAFRTLAVEAKSVSEVLQVQSQLFQVRQQIEQLQGERDHLDQAASLATIHYSLYEPGALVVSPPEPATGLARSLERAVDGSVAVVGGMIVVIGWLVPLAVLGLLGWLGSRLFKRRGPSTPEPATTA